MKGADLAPTHMTEGDSRLKKKKTTQKNPKPANKLPTSAGPVP